MMMTEMDIETSVYYVHLTRLIAREDFIKFTRRESTKTYNSLNTPLWRGAQFKKSQGRFSLCLRNVEGGIIVDSELEMM
jgi:hypothetical protein